ncbi:transposase [Patescibacteria group bacterium]|nr:transposase [Patescibacteria group bacterium]
MPVVDGEVKTSVTTLMAFMAGEVVKGICAPCLLVLDAYFAVGPVFLMLKQVVGEQGQRLAHIVTRAKSNVVAYEDPPPRTGRRGAPRKYGKKISLTSLFNHKDLFQEVVMDIYQERKTILFYCVDLLWKPIKEKVRFVLVLDEGIGFILMGSDLTLPPEDMIMAYSYRFKIEVSFKVMKHLIGAFFYHFWTKAWPRIRESKERDLSSLKDREKHRIALTANAIEAFVNFGCIATGILQILALNHEHRIWQNYKGWLRTISSAIPSEEIVKSVIQEEFFHNFHSFSNSAIYRIIMSKRKKIQYNDLSEAA